MNPYLVQDGGYGQGGVPHAVIIQNQYGQRQAAMIVVPRDIPDMGPNVSCCAGIPIKFGM